MSNYERLVGLKFENVAISEQECIKKLYKVSFSNSRRATGISSFVKQEIEKILDAGYAISIAKEDNISLPPDKKDWIITEDVHCVKIKNLLNKYGIKKCDLIMIDTEGYDFEIIKTIPFELIKPGVIIYEHSHFNEYIKNECSEFLIQLGYRLTKTESDTIAELV